MQRIAGQLKNGREESERIVVQLDAHINAAIGKIRVMSHIFKLHLDHVSHHAVDRHILVIGKPGTVEEGDRRGAPLFGDEGERRAEGARGEA